jgi:hypothetical protein
MPQPMLMSAAQKAKIFNITEFLSFYIKIDFRRNYFKLVEKMFSAKEKILFFAEKRFFGLFPEKPLATEGFGKLN